VSMLPEWGTVCNGVCFLLLPLLNRVNLVCVVTED
jgi:hypothetical protein